jgi:hypothetical protein
MPGNKKPRKKKTGVVKGKVKKGVAKGEAWNNHQQQHEKSHQPKTNVNPSSQNRQPQKHGD